jgi:hypothetical protein
MLFLPAAKQGPNGYPDEDDGHNNPDNKIRRWERPGLYHYLNECDKTRDDNNDSQN